MQAAEVIDDNVITGLETLPEYARLMAKFGRFEDTYIVHAAEGETVVPMEVLDKNPALKEMLFNQMRDMGIQPERYVVGNKLNSINPVTGQPEFFLKKLWQGVKSVLKVAAPVIGAIAGSFIPIPIVGPMIGSFVASKIAGYDTKSALLGAAASGIGAWGLGGSAAAAAGGYTGSIGGTSLGSSLWNGAVTQGGGLGSLISRAAPSAIAGMPTNAATIGGQGAITASQGAASSFTAALGADAATTAAAATAPAAATNFASGTIAAPLVNFALKNPGMVLAGGAALASMLDKPEKIKPSLTNTTTGYDVYSKNPDAYNVGNLGPASVSYGDGSQNMVSNYQSIPMSTIPQIDYNTSFAQFPVQPYQPYVAAKAGGHIKGPGTGTSDSIPALLSDGEFVMTAAAVRGAGKGDRKKGARKMYQMMKQYEALSHG
jgi:hypothetical protein